MGCASSKVKELPSAELRARIERATAELHVRIERAPLEKARPRELERKLHLKEALLTAISDRPKAVVQERQAEPEGAKVEEAMPLGMPVVPAVVPAAPVAAVALSDTLAAEAESPTRAETTMQVLQRLKVGLREYPKEVWAWPEGKLYLERIASLEPASVPKTNESIREAVADFKAESQDFKSPKAERKWGPLADWDVSNVTNMNG